MGLSATTNGMDYSPLILSLDQGTTSSRALVFDSAGQIVSVAQQEFTQYFPESGWVEHDPEEIWQTTILTARAALKDAEERTDGRVVCIGIANQRETTFVWDNETGKSIGRAIVWQDRRTADMCAELKRSGREAEINQKTGLTLDPYFSGTKLRWLIENSDAVAQLASRGTLAFGTCDSFLLHRLSGGTVHATDETNASRTLLYNIEQGEWDADILSWMGARGVLLPTVHPSAARFGKTVPELFGRPIPITGMAGDQQAAAFGQACWEPGMVKSTYGTGCFMLVNTGSNLLRSEHRLLSTIACRIGDDRQYAVEGSIFIAGAVSQWLRDELGLIAHASETEALASSIASTDGVYLVPAFTGLGAPHWTAEARGTVFGLTRGTGRAELVRAAVEAVGYQTHDLVEALRADGLAPSRIRVDGGMVQNSWFVQFLADILDMPIDRPKVIESTARGAAFLAGLEAGVFSNADALLALWEAERSFEPQMDAETRTTLLRGWSRAVDATLYHARNAE